MPERIPDPVAADAQFVADLTAQQAVLHAFLISLLPGDPDVEDVLQRTNLVLWKKREQFEPGSSFKSWSLAVAYWEARAWMTERKRGSWLVFDDDLAGAIIGRFAALPPQPPNATATLLRVCLGKLREADRLLVLSHHQHGKSLRECEGIFNRSAASLKTSLVRIRTALRRCIKAQGSIDQPAS
jgi:RNA polymerase sigma-70 factor, ECF subfamily